MPVSRQARSSWLPVAWDARDYLALSNILCVGGSWVAPKDAMARGDWAAITTLAAEAAALR